MTSKEKLIYENERLKREIIKLRKLLAKISLMLDQAFNDFENITKEEK